jgi:hypothetical protein
MLKKSQSTHKMPKRYSGDLSILGG